MRLAEVCNMAYSLSVVRMDPLTIPWVIHAWQFFHETPRSVHYAKLLLVCMGSTPEYTLSIEGFV